MAKHDRVAIMADVCEQIANGKSLRLICEGPDTPSRSTVQKWLSEDEALSDQYARAREDQADFYADEIIEIADQAKAEDAQIARLRVDARKWKASKLAPRKYGDTISHQHGGAGGGAIKIEVEYI